MPRIGMSGIAVMLLPMREAMAVAIELGYDAFELSGEFPQCLCDQVSAFDRKEARRLVESAGLMVSVHAPFTSLNIAALNPGVRAESIRQVSDAIDLCADIGGKNVTIHNGLYVLSRNFRKKIPQIAEIQWEYNIESLEKIAARALSRGITLCLENIGYEHNAIDRNVDDLLTIRKAVNSPALSFCIDVGHARLNNELEAAIAKLGPYARQVHFTDNFGQTDDHLIIGTGNFDYSPCLDFIRTFDGIVILEVVKVGTDPEAARQSLAYFKSLMGL
ncbi:MAG: sugar phosphate isomerase/epimerase family protein [Thermodesulfobacteriota bacterium]